MAQYTVTPTLVADSYVWETNPTTNYASANPLPFNGFDTGSKYPLFRFDWSVIPVRKRVVSATLSIYQNGTYSGAYSDSMRIVGSADDPATVTWDTRYNGGYEGADGSINAATAGMRAFTVTATLQAMLNAIAAGTYTVGQSALRLSMSFGTWSGGSVTFNSNEAASNRPSLSVTYEDVPPGKPVNLTPVGTYQDSSGVIRLDWDYVSSVGGTQKGFNLQWSSNGGGSWTTISETTANTYRDVAAGTFPAGNITWKVQTINEYDETSVYSDAVTFYSIAAPATPIVTVGAGARPEITWTSDADQQVYQVQILSGSTVVYDSEVQAALATRANTPATYLANAAYTARVRYKNQYDMWSAWGSTSFTVAATAPATPTLSAAVSGRGIALTPGSLAAYTKAILYRCVHGTGAWVPIAIVTGAYQDNAVAHGIQYDYKLRGATSSAYADSTTQTVTAALSNDTIATVDGSAVIDLTMSQEQTAGKTIRDGQQTVMTQYAGRTRPVAEFSGYRASTFASTYHVDSWAEIEAILALAAMCTTVLYRDRRGRKIYGVISTVIPVQDTTFGYAVGLTIDTVEYDEEVAI